ncbi:MAG: DUF488 domain-containing protein [Verrucomicrobiota bacterium]
MVIQTKRVYEPAAAEDGTRFLVDRLWPRGVKKDVLRLDGWLKDVAPSGELRRWFGHDPARWAEFRRRYFAELDRHPERLQPLREAVRHDPVTLLFGASDTRHNNAVALREYLEAKEPTSATKGNSVEAAVYDTHVCGIMEMPA